MTAPLEIATGMIDKLQEENRVQLEAYHTANDRIKYLERRLADKEKLIKVLEERLHTGTEGILEMTNREKDRTIKNLEAQIQTLLKQNEDIEIRLEAIRSEICPKCETKLLLGESAQSKNIAKSYKPHGQVSSTLYEKKTSQVFSPNRLKTLERIVEHKDKRIGNLSKEVQRLTKIEKELTQKVYRLSKLMPISRLPPETITDCLLKEIQSLEAQGYKSSTDLSNKLLKDISSTRFSKSKVCPSKSTDKSKKPSISNLKRSAENLLASSERIEAADTDGVQNVILFRKLQKLFTDVNELKHLFASESKKLSEELNTATTDYEIFKIHLEEIIDNLNEVVHSIIGSDFEVHGYNPSSSCCESSRKRLKDLLAMITEYEIENKTLKERLNQLQAQQCFCSLDRRRLDNEVGNPSETQNVNEIRKLKETIKFKDDQLAAFEKHVDTCQKFIQELQKKDKQGSFEKLPSFSSVVVEGKSSNCCAQDKKILQTKLDNAEQTIKTLETVVKRLQDSVCCLEGEKEKIESELREARNTLAEALEINSGALYSKTSINDTHVNNLQQFNEQLQSKIKELEKTNSKLEACAKLHEVEKASVEQERALLKTKIEAAEKEIETLNNTVINLSDSLQVTKDAKTKLEANLKRITTATDLAEAYKKDIVSLENELSLKEAENSVLKQSLQALEDSALQMNHYRKSLHKEIETLCKALMENDDTEDSIRRKAIYKAAVLRSAQALLRLDENFNLKPEDSGRNSALEEMKHQVEVYLTEVSRIHELVTIKEQERDELLKEYLDLPGDADLRTSTSLLHESHVRGEATDADLQSCPNLNPTASELPKKRDSKSAVDLSETSAQLKLVLEELEQTKSVTAFLLSSCTRLEDSLLSEKTEHAMCKRELELCKEKVKDLETHLSIKDDMYRRLHSRIEIMCSKEYNADNTIEHLKSEIKWLVEKNQEIFENVATTRSELNQCKEENIKIQRDLDFIKKQLRNEQYENSKVNNELKHLRLQLLTMQCTLDD